jgi:Transposase DDE domain
MARLLRRCRGEAGRDPEPSVALLDAHSVPSGHLGPREEVGIDGGKRVRGRKRHLLCDINGLPIAIGVSSAQPHDSRGGWTLLETVTPQLTRLTKVFADAAYTGLVRRAGAELDVTIDIRRRPAGTPLVRPTPAAVAGRADLRLARPQPPAPPRLRSHCDLVPDIRPRGHRGVHAEPAIPDPITRFPLSEVCLGPLRRRRPGHADSCWPSRRSGWERRPRRGRGERLGAGRARRVYEPVGARPLGAFRQLPPAESPPH